LFSVDEEELVGTLQDMLNTAQFDFERRDVVMAAIGQHAVGPGPKGRIYGLADCPALEGGAQHTQGHL